MRKVIHLEFREPVDGKRHYYFGSKSAIFQRFTSKQIGLTRNSIRNVRITNEESYANKLCTIWQGELITSLQNREKQ